MGGVESRISASQSAGSRARLLAESGIEYAFLSLVRSSTSARSSRPAPRSVPAGTPLPGLLAASGTFGVTIRNDITAGDALLTGAALDTASVPAGSATSDVNGIVILTSTGIVDGATRVIVAVVQRGNLNLNAAVTLPGVQADTTTDSPCQNSALSRRSDRATTPSTAGTGCGPTPRRPREPRGPSWVSPRHLGTESTVEDGFSDSYRSGLRHGSGRDQERPGI